MKYLNLVEEVNFKDDIYDKMSHLIFQKKQNKPSQIIPKCFSMPVNFLESHFESISNKNYVVGDKTDGVRFLLFVTDNKNYIISRLGDVYALNICILNASEYNNSIIDGELVENNNDIYYVAFDVLVFKNVSYVKQQFDIRYKCLFPLKVNKLANLIFIVKTFYKTSHVKPLLQQVIPSMPYKNDGLIFIDLNDCSTPGTNDKMFKWKRAEEHTIDFKVSFKLNMFSFFTCDKKDPVFTCKELNFENIDYIKNNKSTIVEFMYFNNQYIPVKIRDDKPCANSYKTYISTMESIKQNITIEIIIKTLTDN